MLGIRLDDTCGMHEATTKQICFGQVREYIKAGVTLMGGVLMYSRAGSLSGKNDDPSGIQGGNRWWYILKKEQGNGGCGSNCRDHHR